MADMNKTQMQRPLMLMGEAEAGDFFLKAEGRKDDTTYCFYYLKVDDSDCENNPTFTKFTIQAKNRLTAYREAIQRFEDFMANTPRA